jgi:hypothetical protein
LTTTPTISLPSECTDGTLPEKTLGVGFRTGKRGTGAAEKRNHREDLSSFAFWHGSKAQPALAQPGRFVYMMAINLSHCAMIELVRTNDAVIISFVESLMRDAGIGYIVADQNMSVLDGSLGILPRRILVESEKVDMARRILTDAGIAHEMRPK